VHDPHPGGVKICTDRGVRGADVGASAVDETSGSGEHLGDVEQPLVGGAVSGPASADLVAVLDWLIVASRAMVAPSMGLVRPAGRGRVAQSSEADWTTSPQVRSIACASCPVASMRTCRVVKSASRRSSPTLRWSRAFTASPRA